MSYTRQFVLACLALCAASTAQALSCVLPHPANISKVLSTNGTLAVRVMVLRELRVAISPPRELQVEEKINNRTWHLYTDTVKIIEEPTSEAPSSAPSSAHAGYATYKVPFVERPMPVTTKSYLVQVEKVYKGCSSTLKSSERFVITHRAEGCSFPLKVNTAYVLAWSEPFRPVNAATAAALGNKTVVTKDLLWTDQWQPYTAKKLSNAEATALRNHKNVCSSIIRITKRPTLRPSKAPVTKRPTKAPTKRPTKAPSKAPVAKPLVNTTATYLRPTKTPTRLPTKKPTKAPTKVSIKAYTKPPSKRPTRAPTKAPNSKRPTRAPTKAPNSKRPTKAPTKAPNSKRPTKAPTKAPTKRPTKAPTKRPTKRPTRAPTKRPTKKPTKAPTKTPTKAPIKATIDAYTKRPVKTPTKAPTKRPTLRPTKKPTRAPSKLPTRAPTKAPVKY